MKKLLCLSVLLTLLLSPTAQETRRLCVQLPKSGAWLRLCRPDGTPLQTLYADENGAACLQPLQEGVYLAVSEYGRAVFVLSQDCLRIRSGCARSCGLQLIVEEVPCGTVIVRRINCTTPHGSLEYLLRGEGYEVRQELSDATEVSTCRFEAIPYGTYTLYEDGVARARVMISAATPELTFNLLP